MLKTAKTKAFFWGTIASLVMAGFYWLIMSLTMKPAELWATFVAVWYLISGIIVGFGIQIGLWVFIRNGVGHRPGAIVPGASGAMSGTAMVACCAHHLADVLPVVGLSGAALFLARYQKPLLILGVAINAFGIALMFHHLQQYKRRWINSV